MANEGTTMANEGTTMANEGTTVANEGTTMANEGTTVAIKGTEIKAKVRVFFWNEKLTRNQISESEGLCVIIIRRSYKWLHECPRIVCYPQTSRWYDTYSSTVIPFDLSRLLNKDPSLFSMILSATLQFYPEDIIQISNEINSELFTKFRLFSKPQPRPPYVIALEISQFDIVGFSSYYSGPPFPPIPSFSRFVKDWDDEEELLTAVRSLSTTDYINDPYHKYLGDVLEYIHALREYTGEGGICPAKPPIAEDLPKGLNEIRCSPSPTPVFNDYSRDLIDDTCPVCYEDFKDKNEVITTYCLHEFHIHCMIKWLSMHNTCPTCRADYPLHYSPLSNCRKRPHHNILEEPNCKRQHIGGASTLESNV